MAIAKASSPIDLRKSQRYPTRIDGTAILNGMRYPIVISDISAEGAMIRGMPLLSAATTFTLQARALDVIAIVVRGTGRGLGVRFQCAVNPLAVVRENYAGLEHLRKPGQGVDADRPTAEAWRQIQ
jgi:hypothetical protein